jgi:hypothetical protein
MTKTISIIILLILFFNIPVSANTIEVIIESSLIHSQDENIIKGFELKGVLYKSFFPTKKILILNYSNFTIIEEVGNIINFQNRDFIITEKDKEFYISSILDSSITKKLEKKF